MSEINLDAIRERLEQAVAPLDDVEFKRHASMRQDIKALLAEMERLETQYIVLYDALEALHVANAALIIGLGQTLGVSMDDDNFPPQMREAIEQAQAALFRKVGG